MTANAKEYCCYTRPYSYIKGLQAAHTLYYSASVEEEGVVLTVEQKQGSECLAEHAFCPEGDFRTLMTVMRYLSENGVGLGQWMNVLDDAGLEYCPCTFVEGRLVCSRPAPFVAFADFVGQNLVHNTELTQSV